MKKIIGLFLVVIMVLSLVACGGKETPSSNNTQNQGTADKDKKEEKKEDSGAATNTVELPPMTTENITLTFCSWDGDGNGFNEEMAKSFTEKYPNINIEIIPNPQATYNDGLINLASAGNLPDVFWYIGNVDIPLRNGWLGDFTEYFENDPETAQIVESVKVQGYFDGERKMAAPSKYLPYVVFLDKNLFNNLNVPMPSASWTYSEMLDTMKKMTVPEQGIFGYNTFTQIFTMAPIINQDAWGEFGWDGEKYDLTKDWAESITQHADFVRTKVHAPFFDTDEAEKAFGDRLLWAGSSGKIAMQLDAFWTINLFSQPEFTDKGINWVPYPVPKGDNAKTEHKPAFMDFGTISPTTKYPREAYEVLKFFGWGLDGWMARMDAYETMTREDGTKIYPFSDCLPLTSDQKAWDAVAKLLPDTPEMKAFFEHAKEPIPLGGAAQPGFSTFLEEDYVGIEAEIVNGEINAFDVAQELTDKLNARREEVMVDFQLLYPKN